MIMPKIERLNRLVTKLRDMAARSRRDDNCSVSVGYAQSYALPVHENLEVVHPHGQAKYLEQPARVLSGDGTLGRVVVGAKRQGKTTAQGLVMAGLVLQGESQKIVPVDTGALRNSAYTRLDNRGR